jgi:hypothetical protein
MGLGGMRQVLKVIWADVLQIAREMLVNQEVRITFAGQKPGRKPQVLKQTWVDVL